MQAKTYYESPLGNILLTADELGITGLWFQEQAYYSHHLESMHLSRENPHFQTAKQWLDIYFSGQKPSFSVPIHPEGTPFQKSVWQALCRIPYGDTASYAQIADQLSPHSSPRAVGNAVSKNKISILIPCHRVIGSSGKLTGYAGGLDKKVFLLKLEKT